MSQNLKNNLTINKYVSHNEFVCVPTAPHKLNLATGRGVLGAKSSAKSEPIAEGNKKQNVGAGFPSKAFVAGQFTEVNTFKKTHLPIIKKIKEGKIKLGDGEKKEFYNCELSELPLNKRFDSVESFLKHLREEYIKIAEEKEQKTQNYLDVHVLKLLDMNEFVGMHFSLKKKMQLDYLYYKSVSDYINRIAESRGLIPIFLTYTLPSEYHPTTTKSGKREWNPNYNNLTINDGYKLLQKAFRELTRYFKKKETNKNLDDIPYIRMMEYHKDYTVHGHAVVFLPESLVELFEAKFHRIRKQFKLGEQYDFEILKDKSKGSGYLLKYLRKTMLSENEADLYVLDGWRKANRIRLFTHSQTFLKRKDFEKILPYYIEDIEKSRHKDCL